MMGRSRVSSTLDIGRLGAALARPGMDPRVTCSLAYAVGESNVSDQGHFVDVLLAPSGIALTCQVAEKYEGPSFGDYAPIHLNDELFVAFPDGDMNHGGVVLGRLYSVADPPPQAVLDNPGDSAKVMESGKTYRLVVSGGGKILLADANASQSFVLGDDFRNAESSKDSDLQGAFTDGQVAMDLAASQFLLGAILNAVPIVGGALALPMFTVVASTAFANMAIAQTTAMTAIETYETTASSSQNFLSEDIKGA